MSETVTRQPEVTDASKAVASRVDAIWIKRARRGVMDPVTHAMAIEGKGLDGNAGLSRFRQVTLIEREAWDVMMQELSADIDPSARRANIMVSGCSLRETRDQLLAIGQVRLRVMGETKPCERMDEALPGLREVMQRDWRGGVFAQVIEGGPIAVGDPVRFLDRSR
jgi:MOSC domain-containing protein YiiM